MNGTERRTVQSASCALDDAAQTTPDVFTMLRFVQLSETITQRRQARTTCELI